jgi:hypothetical protein
MCSIKGIGAPKNWQSLKRSELSAMFLDMNEADHHMVIHDMEKFGFRGRPVLLRNGEVMDGWHQLSGAIDAKVTPTFEEFAGTDDEAFAEAWRRNGARRHYDSSQRAMLAAMVSKRGAGRPETGNSANLQNSFPADEAGEIMNVSPRSVQDAKKVIDEGTPALAHAVRNGFVSVSDAAKIVDQPANVQNAAVADVKKGKAKTASGAVKAKILCERCQRVGETADCEACKEARKKKPKKKGKRKKKAPEPRAEITDALGQPLPDHLRDAFADPQLGHLIEDLEAAAEMMMPEQQLVRACKLCDHYGFILADKFKQHVYDALHSQQLAIEALKAGVPHAICPKCKAVDSKKDGKVCRGCRGFGFVPVLRYAELTKGAL